MSKLTFCNKIPVGLLNDIAALMKREQGKQNFYQLLPIHETWWGIT